MRKNTAPCLCQPKTLSNENTQLKEQLAKVTSDCQELQKNVSSLEGQLQTDSTTLNNAHQEELASLRDILTTKEQEVTRLQTEVGSLSGQLVEAERKVLDKETSSKTAEEASTELRDELQKTTEALETLSVEKQKLEQSLADLTQHKDKELESLKIKHKEEIDELKEEVREAESVTERADEEWKTKFEEMVVTVNLEREKLIQEHNQKSSETLSHESSMAQQVKELHSQCDRFKSDLESVAKERMQEQDTSATKVGELELQMSNLQEQMKQRVIEVERKAEERVALMKKQCQTKLKEKNSQVDSQMQQVQLELERKYSQEKAALLAKHDTLLESHNREMKNTEERYSYEIDDLKRTLNSMRAEVQEAKDNQLAESERSSKMEQQLLELQAAHQLEIDAINSSHQQELFEQRSQREASPPSEGGEDKMAALKERHATEVRDLQQRVEKSAEKTAQYKTNVARLVVSIVI